MSRALPTRMSLPVIFGVAFATGFTGAVVPGSLLAVVVRETLRFGWTAGPLLMVGHALLELVAVVLLATGLIRFVRTRWLQALIGGLGAAVLIYLGYGTLCYSPDDAVRALSAAGAAGGAGATGLLALIGLGAVMSMANPYWWLWWATICPTHIAWAVGRGRVGGGVYYVGHILSDVVWYSAVSIALAVAADRAVLSPRLLQGIYLGAGVFLVAMGLVFLVAAARTLWRRESALAVEG